MQITFMQKLVPQNKRVPYAQNEWIFAYFEFCEYITLDDSEEPASKVCEKYLLECGVNGLLMLSPTSSNKLQMLCSGKPKILD